MKKSISLFLALAMVFCLASCSAGDAGNTGAAASGSASSTQSTASASGSTVSMAPTFEKMTIKLAHTAAESHIHNLAVQQFAANVSERTGGAVTVEIYPAGELGDAPALAEQVSLGAIDMNICSQSNFATYMPKANAIAAPYLFESYDHAHNVIDGYIMGWLNKDSVSAMNVVFLSMFDYGFRQVTTKGIVVNSAADLKGVKIRVPPSAGLLAAFDSLGANTQTIAYAELYQSLKQGVVDAQENPVATIFADSLYECQDNLAITNHYFDMQGLVINADFWNGLSSELQTIVKEEAINAQNMTRDYLSQSESETIAKLKDLGMNVTYPDLSSFVALMDPAYKTMGDLAGAGEMDALLAAVDQYK